MAAYGSELASQVQMLREFRDEKLLSTLAGNQFMEVFDAFYCSFIPRVAEIVGSNNLVSCLTRILLSPLILALRIVTAVPASEAGVIIGGTLAGSLVSLTYLTPLAVLMALAKHGRDEEK